MAGGMPGWASISRDQGMRTWVCRKSISGGSATWVAPRALMNLGLQKVPKTIAPLCTFGASILVAGISAWRMVPAAFCRMVQAGKCQDWQQGQVGRYWRSRDRGWAIPRGSNVARKVKFWNWEWFLTRSLPALPYRCACFGLRGLVPMVDWNKKPFLQRKLVNQLLK